jgi:phosphoribosylformylglycinamidine synthase
MALASKHGIELDLRKVPISRISRNDFILFAESNSRFLVEVPGSAKQSFENLMRGKICSEIGRVTQKQTLSIRGLDGGTAIDASTFSLRHSWQETLGRGE